MSIILNVLSLVLSTAALFVTMWIVIPAPSYHFWLLSVLASEWSLGFGAIALFGIIFGLRATTGKLRIGSLSAGGLSVLFSLYPIYSAYSVAQEQGVSLSPRQYISGFKGEINNYSSVKTTDYTTHTYATVNGSELRLDAYLPEAANGNGAALIVVHGGSWNGGARNDFPQWNRWFARHGLTVFDIDYRLAPQPNWQTATGDVKCAVAWVKRHSTEFGISPDRIAVLGRSAGGHLALLAAYSAGDSRFPSSCPNGENDCRDSAPEMPSDSCETVRAVVSFYAPTDLLWGYDHPANRLVIDGPATLRRFLGGNPHESEEIRKRFSLASPVAQVNARTPPTLLIHGGKDQLVRSENAELLGGKLSENKVPHKIVFIPYAQHGFDYNFDGWGSQIAQAVILDFLRENTQAR